MSGHRPDAPRHDCLDSQCTLTQITGAVKDKPLSRKQVVLGDINARSLVPSGNNSTMHEIRDLVRTEDIDILCISETWLHKAVKDKEVSIPGFTMFQKDRTKSKGKRANGGGVAIFARNTLQPVTFTLECDIRAGLEAILAVVRLPGQPKTMVVGAAYRVP